MFDFFNLNTFGNYAKHSCIVRMFKYSLINTLYYLFFSD